MPRPKKCRRVCGVPPCAAFGPKDGAAPCETVPLALDEYETIRLIDLEGLQQEQAAQAMGVGRATVQAIYTSARRKLADCVVHGKLSRGGKCQTGSGKRGFPLPVLFGEGNVYEALKFVAGEFGNAIEACL